MVVLPPPPMLLPPVLLPVVLPPLFPFALPLLLQAGLVHVFVLLALSTWLQARWSWWWGTAAWAGRQRRPTMRST